ncbi:MAG: hypothetical protein R3C11_20475 [Planctomycetaceae bacterium]
MPGCGQDRPGIRFDETHDPGPENKDYNNPDMLEEKLTRLIGLVKSDSMNKARRSANTLAGMGAQAEPVLEDLKALKDHPDPEVKEAINKAIEAIEGALNACSSCDRVGFENL